MDKSEVKLQCLRIASDFLGVYGYTPGEKEQKLTTEQILDEAKKMWEWVSSEKET